MINAREKSNYFPYMETWLLDNKINITISFYEKEYILSINSESGDIVDQVFDRLKKHENFENIKLTGGSRYFLNIDISLVKEIIDFVEKIDISTLKEGKSY